MLAMTTKTAANDQLPRAMLEMLSRDGMVPLRTPQTPRLNNTISRPSTRPNTMSSQPSPRARRVKPLADDPARPLTSTSQISVVSQRTFFAGSSAPASLYDLDGSVTALPSERAQARQLQEALIRAFERSDGELRPPMAMLLEEWDLLDRCTARLVKLTATHCLEWSQTLELIRQRLTLLWEGASAMLSSLADPEAAKQMLKRKPIITNNEDLLTAEVVGLRAELSAYEERAILAERRLMETQSTIDYFGGFDEMEKFVLLSTQVELQEAELRSCRALIEELSRSGQRMLVLLPEGSGADEAEKAAAKREADRLVAEKAEAERVARIAAQKIELDKAKAERMAAMAAAVAEKEKADAEQRAAETAESAKRMGAGKAEADRLAQLAAEKAEAERMATQASAAAAAAAADAAADAAAAAAAAANGDLTDVMVEQLKMILSRNHARVIDLFRLWDINSDMRISRPELRRAFDELGFEIPGGALDALFTAFDVNGNQYIDYPEMHNRLRSWAADTEGIVVHLKCMLAEDKGKVIDMFRKWDASGDGRIHQVEVRCALLWLGYEATTDEVSSLFKVLDLDGYGSIEYNEMYKVLKRTSDAQLALAQLAKTKEAAAEAVQRVSRIRAVAEAAAPEAAEAAAKAAADATATKADAEAAQQSTKATIDRCSSTTTLEAAVVTLPIPVESRAVSPVVMLESPEAMEEKMMLEQSIRDKEEILERTRLEAKELMSQNTQLTADKQQLMSQNTQLTADKQHLTSQNTQLTTDKQQLLAEVDKLRATADGAAAAAAAAAAQLICEKAQLTTDKQHLLTELEQALAEIEQLRSELLREKTQQKGDKHVLAEIEQLRSELMSENAQLKAEKEQLLAELEQLRSEHLLAETQLVSETTQLKADRQQQLAENEQLRSDLDEMRSLQSLLHSKVTELQAKVTELQSQVTELSQLAAAELAATAAAAVVATAAPAAGHALQQAPAPTPPMSPSMSPVTVPIVVDDPARQAAREARRAAELAKISSQLDTMLTSEADAPLPLPTVDEQALAEPPIAPESRNRAEDDDL
jgi:Ca2+-binding EF-hand superfamily protein